MNKDQSFMRRFEDGLGAVVDNLFSEQKSKQAYRAFFKMAMTASLLQLMWSMMYLIKFNITWGNMFHQLSLPDLAPMIISYFFTLAAVFLAIRGLRLLNNNEFKGFWYLMALTAYHTFSLFFFIGFYGLYAIFNKSFRTWMYAEGGEKIKSFYAFCSLETTAEDPTTPQPQKGGESS